MSSVAEAGSTVRRLALLAWATVGAGMILESWVKEGRFYPACTLSWAVAFLISTASFLHLQSLEDRRDARPAWLIALSLQAVAVLFMIAWWRSLVGGLLLVLVAWQAAHFLQLRGALAWTAAQTALLALVSFPREPHGSWAIATLICGGLQLFATLGARLAERERRNRLELARSNSELRETLRLLSDRTSAAERTALARDLHDGLGHRLTAISLALESASLQSSAPSSGIARASALVRGTFDELRRVVGGLRADDRYDLARALGELVAEIGRPRVELHISGDLESIDAARGHTLLRCAQELVTNAIRHSGAERLRLELACEGARARLEAHDDGHGGAGFPEGYGLRGIRERVSAFAGTLLIDPAAPGFAVLIELPLESEPR